MKKQAVVVIHGVGEQIPMDTLTSFVNSVWTTDDKLVSSGKPDPDTGGKRSRNASWSKPDPRNRSFELRVITTETGSNGKRTDFYETSAHLMHGTTWEQFRGWVFELMWRNPFRDVPRGVLAMWAILWLITLGAGLFILLSLKPAATGGDPSWLGAIAAALLGAATWAGSGFLVRYLGDAARYVKAKPLNVARRQEMRENGVRLLETLTGFEPDGTLLAEKDRDYDRIVVVGHSLGSIIAYDILTQAFARMNTIVAETLPDPFPTEQRVKIEQMIRDGLPPPAETAAEPAADPAAPSRKPGRSMPSRTRRRPAEGAEQNGQSVDRQRLRHARRAAHPCRVPDGP